MESKSVKDDHCTDEPELQSLKQESIHEPSQETVIVTQINSESAEINTEGKDGSDSGMDRDPEEGELEMPLFVEIKEEPNRDSDVEAEAGNFEESFEERTRYSEEKGNRMVTSENVGTAQSSSEVLVMETLATETEGKCRQLRKRRDRVQEGEKSSRSQNDKALSQSGSFNASMQISGGDKPYKCSHCNKAYGHSSNLSAHMRIHTGKKPYLCSQCGKSFSYFGNLTDHMRIHTGERPYKCTECEKAFSHGSSLTAHLRTHTEEKPYVCTVCNKAFCRRYHLSTHMRVHTGEKPYKCTQCDKGFSQSNALTVHMRIHTGEKPYKCHQCDKAFAQSNALVVHLQTHTGEKPHKCHLCDKAFTQSYALTVHLQTHSRRSEVHEGENFRESNC